MDFTTTLRLERDRRHSLPMTQMEHSLFFFLHHLESLRPAFSPKLRFIPRRNLERAHVTPVAAAPRPCCGREGARPFARASAIWEMRFAYEYVYEGRAVNRGCVGRAQCNEPTIRCHMRNATSTSIKVCLDRD